MRNCVTSVRGVGACVLGLGMLGCASAQPPADPAYTVTRAQALDLIAVFADAPPDQSVDALVAHVGVEGVRVDRVTTRTEPFSTRDGYRVSEVSMRRRLPDDNAPAFMRLRFESTPCLDSRTVASRFKLPDEGLDQTVAHGRVAEASITLHPYHAGSVNDRRVKVYRDASFCTVIVTLNPDSGASY